MSDRKYIPVSMKRALLDETVYRCASCLCSIEHCEDDGTFFRFDEKAHINPHSNTQDDSFENLITLCPTCHTKFDKNKDREKSLERLRSLKRQWLGISGKYSKLEIDCLLDIYNKKESYWVKKIIVKDTMDFNKGLLQESLNTTITNYQNGDCVEPIVTPENIKNILKNILNSAIEDTKHFHSKPKEEIKNIIETQCTAEKGYFEKENDEYYMYYEFYALAIQKCNSFLLRNILTDSLIQEKDISSADIMICGVDISPTYFVLTNKGNEMCKKLI